MARESQDLFEKALTDIIDIYLVVRVLREWDRGRWARANPLSERETLALVVLEQCGQEKLLERELGGILGLPPSSASDMVKRLLSLGLVERRESGTDAREKPLSLSARGKTTLENMRRIMCERFSYFFEDIREGENAADAKIVKHLTGQIRDTVAKRLRKEIFVGDNPLPSE